MPFHHRDTVFVLAELSTEHYNSSNNNNNKESMLD